MSRYVVTYVAVVDAPTRAEAEEIARGLVSNDWFAPLSITGPACEDCGYLADECAPLTHAEWSTSQPGGLCATAEDDE